MIYFGLDPGQSGAIAALPSLEFLKFKDATERDVWNWIQAQGVVGGDADMAWACIERVGPARGRDGRKQGVSSAFKFGKSYGFLRGLLVASGMPFVETSPQKWQTVMNCRTKGDKNVSKAMAQQLFPAVKMTHANADAFLLAEYCRREIRYMVPWKES